MTPDDKVASLAIPKSTPTFSLILGVAIKSTSIKKERYQSPAISEQVIFLVEQIGNCS